jgi:hypothetical protein
LTKARSTRLLRVLPLIKAFCIVALIRLGLSTIGYNRLRRIVPVAGGAAPPELIKSIAWAVRRSARLVPGASCLTQALAVQFLLARRGFKSIIKVGVREDAGKILAHAWLVSEDRVAIGGSMTALAAYTAIANLTPP